ncbi:MAG: hypothetical protein E7Z66_03530 [Thermoplasmata archaeon]|nr:hypothetical protein [Thermoplasmata archaeon]
MDNKLFVTIIVVAVVIAGVSTAAFMYNAEDDTEDNSNMFNVIARANSEGSGLYIKSDLVNSDSGLIPVRASNNVAFFNSDWTVSPDNAAAWGGLVFGTPGTSSIQHTQLADLASQMGLKFTLYSTSASTSNDTIYYDSGIANSGQALSNTIIDGGILWEPQYQLIISDKSHRFVSLALTNDVFEDHTCCIIAGNTEYMLSNESATERFLAGYVNAVDDINEILKNKDSNVDEYNEFVEFVMTKVSALANEKQVTMDALANITYLYADDSEGNLNKLESDISELVDNLEDLGIFKKTVKNSELFAEEFVTQTYLKKAIAGDYESTGKVNVKVAVITGDIHQIAIHWGIQENYFSDVGVTVDVVGSTNGAGVATALVNGEATFGFLGAPPATITTVNSGYIVA